MALIKPTSIDHVVALWENGDTAEISTPQEYIYMQGGISRVENPNPAYWRRAEITADLDFTGQTYRMVTSSYGAYWRIRINGNGHKITNINFVPSNFINNTYGALFGAWSQNDSVHISNLIIEKCNFELPSSNLNNHIALLAGSDCQNIIIKDCYIAPGGLLYYYDLATTTDSIWNTYRNIGFANTINMTRGASAFSGCYNIVNGSNVVIMDKILLSDYIIIRMINGCQIDNAIIKPKIINFPPNSTIELMCKRSTQASPTLVTNTYFDFDFVNATPSTTVASDQKWFELFNSGGGFGSCSQCFITTDSVAETDAKKGAHMLPYNSDNDPLFTQSQCTRANLKDRQWLQEHGWILEGDE